MQFWEMQSIYLVFNACDKENWMCFGNLSVNEYKNSIYFFSYL